MSSKLNGTSTIEVISLKKGKSIEDYVPFPQLLEEAIKIACGELVKDSIRKYSQPNFDKTISERISTEFGKTTEGKTLGKRLEILTAGFFDPPNKLSKLHLARVYDDLADAKNDHSGSTTSAELALGLALEIKKKLSLKTREAQKRVLSKEA